MSATAANGVPDQSEHRQEILLVVGLTALALVLRAVGANSGLWIDEILSLDAVRRPAAEILGGFKGENQHTLYALLAHASRHLFGEHPWSLRLPAILFGTACVPMLYLLGRQLGMRREGLLAALLLATSYHHVWFSQNARGYTALTFFTLTSTLAMLAWLERPRPAAGLAWALSIALGVHTLLTMAFVAVAQSLVAAFWIGRRGDDRSKLGRWVPLFGLLGLGVLLALLLYGPAIQQVVSFYLTDRPFVRPRSRGLVWALWEGAIGLRLGFGSWAALLMVGVLGTIGAWKTTRSRPLAMALMTVPAAVTVLGALLVRGAFVPRYLFHFLPFGLLILQVGLMSAVEALGRRLHFAPRGASRAAVGATLLLVACQVPVLARSYRFPKQDFEGALEWVETEAEPGDVIAVLGATHVYRSHWGRPWPLLRWPRDVEALDAAERVWILYTLPRLVARDNPMIWGLLVRRCAPVRAFPGTLGGGAVTVCRLEPADPAERTRGE